MEEKLKKLLTVDFFYLLFSVGMIPLIVSCKNLLDIGYYVIITICYIRLKLYDKKII